MLNHKYSAPADPHREFPDATKPLAPPPARIGDIELLSQTISIRIWAMRSKHDLATVLSDGFFDGLKDVHLKKEDRIECVASWGQPIAEHSTLVVDQVDGTGKATVLLMLRYERQH